MTMHWISVFFGKQVPNFSNFCRGLWETIWTPLCSHIPGCSQLSRLLSCHFHGSFPYYRSWSRFFPDLIPSCLFVMGIFLKTPCAKRSKAAVDSISKSSAVVTGRLQNHCCISYPCSNVFFSYWTCQKAWVWNLFTLVSYSHNTLPLVTFYYYCSFVSILLFQSSAEFSNQSWRTSHMPVRLISVSFHINNRSRHISVV
jgi:hypothetical protein